MAGESIRRHGFPTRQWCALAVLLGTASVMRSKRAASSRRVTTHGCGDLPRKPLPRRHGEPKSRRNAPSNRKFESVSLQRRVINEPSGCFPPGIFFKGTEAACVLAQRPFAPAVQRTFQLEKASASGPSHSGAAAGRRSRPEADLGGVSGLAAVAPRKAAVLSDRAAAAEGCRAAPACRVAERGASDLMQAMDRSFHAS
jgi:hypothetical protein